MTPTLAGRIETRLFLNFLVAFPVLALLGMVRVFFIMVALGVVLDFLYHTLQHKRWEGDWPHLYALLSGTLEGLLLWVIISLAGNLEFSIFVLIYSLIWASMYIFQSTLLNIFFPKRRFQGGKIM